MGDMLSQDEIDALLNNSLVLDEIADTKEELNENEKDALGEIGNISMGTAATTLSYLIGKKVTITTPVVEITSWSDLLKSFEALHVGVRIEYRKGLEGSNILILKEGDVKLITDLMMGGDGGITDSEISDLHLSAISEAMNQMVGSASTSMSDMFGKVIEISPPTSFLARHDYDEAVEGYEKGNLVKISFKMTIGDLIDSQMMQIMPMGFARKLVKGLMGNESPAEEPESDSIASDTIASDTIADEQSADDAGYVTNERRLYDEEDYRQDEFPETRRPMKKDAVNVQPARFEAFDSDLITVEKKNINLIMDVPLEVTVELGRTQKLIREILELSPGSIIELDKLAGEPVDILVNGKKIAKGEVVVIDESFGVRITDIVHASKRI